MSKTKEIKKKAIQINNQEVRLKSKLIEKIADLLDSEGLKIENFEIKTKFAENQNSIVSAFTNNTEIESTDIFIRGTISFDFTNELIVELQDVDDRDDELLDPFWDSDLDKTSEELEELE